VRTNHLSSLGPIELAICMSIGCGSASHTSGLTGGDGGDGSYSGEGGGKAAMNTDVDSGTSASDGSTQADSGATGGEQDSGGSPGSNDSGGPGSPIDSGGPGETEAAAPLCAPPTGTTPAITVTVNAASAVRTIPDDLYGYNGEVWGGDENGSNQNYNNLLSHAGFKVMRWMGGSWGDSSAWNDLACIGGWVVTYQQSTALYKTLGIRFQPIVNGSSDRNWCTTDHSEADAIALATSWVQDGALGAKYWEVGNELYGKWEQGSTTGSNYGGYFADYYKAMKAANSAIQVLAVGLPQDTSCGDCQPGDTSWTSDLLKAAYAKGVVPDGFQIHIYPGEANDAILHSVLDNIGTATSFLNQTVMQATGHGQLAYAMTEFGVSGNDAKNVARYTQWINAEFTLQYILEMAKNGWAASNTFGALWNSNYRASPTWYVYAFLYGKFGRDLVTSSSSSADVRGYASLGASGQLTVFLANNAATANTVRVNVSNYGASCTGQLWVMQGAAGGGESATDIDINGVEHPAESSAQSMAGVSLATGDAFDVPLPANSLALVTLSH
jgi:hypothetical protein